MKETIKLCKKTYMLMKTLDFSELGDNLTYDDNRLSFETTDVDLVLTIITENIAGNGMDEDQEYCTEYGRDLYMLYDEICYNEQIHGEN